MGERILKGRFVLLGFVDRKAGEINNPGARWIPDDIRCIDPRAKHVAIRLPIWVTAQFEQTSGQFSGNIKAAVFFDALKTGAGVFFQSASIREIQAITRSEVGVDGRNGSAVENRRSC